MIDDVLNLKVATIKRCVSRAREEYRRESATFAADLSRQDAAILNIVHACDAALDMGQHLIHCEHLGIPESPCSVDDRAHASATGRKASAVRAPTQERGSHQ